MMLFHYTDEQGMKGIVATGLLLPSTAAKNPNDVRFGNGQYLSDVPPGVKTPAQLSRLFLNLPYWGKRFTHFVELDVDGLEVIAGRPGVLVVPNDEPLEVSNRIVRYGPVTGP
jgi:hypothetical protein